jgi:invasion protein IalB
MVPSRIAVCLPALLAWLLASDVYAQSAAQQQTPAPQSGWVVPCDGQAGALDCRVSQTLVVKETGQLLISVIVRRPSKTENPTLLLQLPHGIFLPAGISLQIDKGKPEVQPVQTCDARGCYVGMAVSKELFAALSNGETMLVVVQDLQKHPITISLPLKGFAEAFRKLP